MSHRSRGWRALRRAALGACGALLGWACAHTHFQRGGETFAIDREACCAVREGTDLVAERDACAARGCSWQPQLLCMGVPMPDDMEAEYRATSERCERLCACVCPADEEACRNVP